MTTATRQDMERETGISSFEDIKKYLQEALQEIRRVMNDGNQNK